MITQREIDKKVIDKLALSDIHLCDSEKQEFDFICQAFAHAHGNLANALIDVSHGEFERIKEFGVKLIRPPGLLDGDMDFRMMGQRRQVSGRANPLIQLMYRIIFVDEREARQ